jgi:hypothetical protein
VDKVVSLWYGGVVQEVSMAQRRQHGGAFTTRVVVEAIAGHKTVNEIAGAYEVHPSQLRRIFSSTNLIESCFSRAGDLCRGVKRWRDVNMACRWAASVLLEAQSRFRRIQTYSQLPQLINAMAALFDRQETAA